MDVGGENLREIGSGIRPFHSQEEMEVCGLLYLSLLLEPSRLRPLQLEAP